MHWISIFIYRRWAAKTVERRVKKKYWIEYGSVVCSCLTALWNCLFGFCVLLIFWLIWLALILAKSFTWIIIKTHPIWLVYHISHSVIDKYQQQTNTHFSVELIEYTEKRKKKKITWNEKYRRSHPNERDISISKKYNTNVMYHHQYHEPRYCEKIHKQNYLFTFLFNKFEINKRKLVD